MDIFINKPNKNIKIIDNIKYFSKIKDLNSIFDLFTKFNLDKDKSNLLVKKYDTINKSIIISNENEFNLLNDFINNNKEISNNKKVNETREGNIIMDGYKKCLLENNYINLELNELFDKIEYNTSFKIEKNEDLIISFHKLKYYKTTIEDRFFYFGTLIFFYKNKEINRLPLYKDKLHSIYIYTERVLINKYLSFININKGYIFYSYNKIENKVELYYYYNNDIIKFKIKDELSCYEEFESYINNKYLNEIKYLEENIN